MSASRRAPSAAGGAVSAPNTLMGPPPVPQHTMAAHRNKDEDADVATKYRLLKDKYAKIKEERDQWKSESHDASRRITRVSEQNKLLLDRINLLTAQLQGAPIDPRDPRPPLLPFMHREDARTAFIDNIRRARDEGAREDLAADPMFASRYAGPRVRKREDDERARQQAEEDVAPAREQGTPAKRRRTAGASSASASGSAKARGKDKEREHAHPHGHAHGHGHGHPRDLGPPLAFTPLRSSGLAHPPTGHTERSPSPPPAQRVPKRLRLKLPPAPAADGAHARAPDAGAAQYPHHALPPLPHAHGGYGPPPPGAHGMPPPGQQALSPVHSPHDTRLLPHGYPGPLPDLPPYHRRGSNASMHTPPHEHAPAGGAYDGGSRMTKPKRLKAHTVSSKTYQVPVIPRDKHGRPALPLNVGIMQVHSLGRIKLHDSFHTERYIFPVGYEVSRRYMSMVDPTQEVMYQCSINDSGDQPNFQVVAADIPDKPIVAGTATGAWAVVVRTANHIRNRQHSNSVSGPDFFGLGQNTIKHLIQELPGASSLKNYVWQHFVEGATLGGRHATVVPAVHDEYEPMGGMSPYHDEHERWHHDGGPPLLPPLHHGEPGYPPEYASGRGTPRHERMPMRERRPSGDAYDEREREREDEWARARKHAPHEPLLPHERREAHHPHPHDRRDAHAPHDRRDAHLSPRAHHRERERERDHGGPPPGAHPVPAGLASIMNAYPA